MAVDLRTTQEYLNDKCGTVGLTKQQCLQYLAGATGIGMTGQDAANNYAGLNSRMTIQGALNRKVGIPIQTANDQYQLSNTTAESFGQSTVRKSRAQNFVPSLGRLQSITFQRKASTGTYIGDVTISIQGNSTATNIPSGVTSRFIQTIPNATWEAITPDTDQILTCSVSLNLNQSYWIVFESSTSDNSNYANIAGAVASNYTKGPMKIYDGTNWNLSGDVLYFKTTCEIVERMTTQEAARRL